MAISASVPLRHLFEDWAAKKTDVSKLSEILELQHSEALGIHAVAKSLIHPGDLIISEEVLLRIPPVEGRLGELGEFLAPALAVDWSATTPELREACLRLFYAHPEVELRSRSSHLAACEELLQRPALKATKWTPEDLLHFLHIVDLNIHKDDERPQNAEFTGIFLLGSKFSHSCAPNSSWFFQDGRLCYRAIRPIAPGDALTFSYVGNGMNLMCSTHLRRQRLSQLCFRCSCRRCNSEDLARRLRCPRSRCPGVVCPQANGVWSCRSCRGEVPVAELPLDVEEELSQVVPAVMQGSVSHCRADMQQLRQLRRRAAELLGKAHWIYFLATFAWLQKCLLCLRNESVIPFTEADLSAASCEAAQWLEEAAPENIEQRLCAFFLAVRLARHVGQGLASWGYDLHNPLKEKCVGNCGKPVALSKLELMGWELKESHVDGPGEEIHIDPQSLKHRLPKADPARLSMSGWC